MGTRNTGPSPVTARRTSSPATSSGGAWAAAAPRRAAARAKKRSGRAMRGGVGCPEPTTRRVPKIHPPPRRSLRLDDDGRAHVGQLVELLHVGVAEGDAAARPGALPPRALPVQLDEPPER